MKGRVVRLAAVTVCAFIVLVIISASFWPVLQSRFRDTRGSLEPVLVDIELPDSDGDGLSDVDETYRYGTDWRNDDSDGDGMPDGWEVEHSIVSDITMESTLDPTDPGDAAVDGDFDGLSNLLEFAGGTDPNDPDTDGDGMVDGWEAGKGLDPLNGNDAKDDLDADGLSNLEEYRAGTDPSNADTDNDTLSDMEEVKLYGTDPLSRDTDSDGMPDGWEVSFGLKPAFADDAQEDPDGDLLANLAEYLNGTSPLASDTDNDLMPDGYEVSVGLLPTERFDGGGIGPTLEALVRDILGLGDVASLPEYILNSSTDGDDDGLTNLEEYAMGTEPFRQDTDGDNLTDGQELIELRDKGPDPLKRDTDGDGLFDDTEILTLGTNATLPDTDGDGLGDRAELSRGTDPLDPDTDDDELTDGWEVEPGRLDQYGVERPQDATDPLDPDTDADMMPDGWEVENGAWDGYSQWTLDPTVDDGDGDADYDGLTNLQEYLLGTHPGNPDTDGDMMPDGWEDLYGLDPLELEDGNGDLDWDGLLNYEEYAYGTNPMDPDTDRDGIPDGSDPYPLGIPAGASWPYPWPFPEFKEEQTIFRATGDCLRYFRMATLTNYSGYWWYKGSLNLEEYPGFIRSDVKSSLSVRSSTFSVEMMVNESMVVSSQFLGFLRPTLGLHPSLLHVTNISGFQGDLFLDGIDIFSLPQSGYNITAEERLYSSIDLRNAPVMPNREVYTLYPSSIIPERTQRLVGRIPPAGEKPYVVCLDIAEYLRSNVVLVNSTEPPPADRERTDWLLFESGEGTQFDIVSAFVLMARMHGIPANMVVGFVPREVAPGVYEANTSDLAVWAEIGLRDLGWVEFDPLNPKLLGPASVTPFLPGDRVASPPSDLDNSTFPTVVETSTYIDQKLPSTSEVMKGNGLMVVIGRVGNIDGVVPGMPVSVYLMDIDPDYRCGSGYTDDEGMFRIACTVPNDLPVGQHRLIAKAHGLAINDTAMYGKSDSADQPVDVVVESNVTITFNAPDSVPDHYNMSYWGHVEDWGHLPLADKEVRVYFDTEYLGTATTSFNGSFQGVIRIDKHAGSYEIRGVSDTQGHYSRGEGAADIDVIHQAYMEIEHPAKAGVGDNIVFQGMLFDDEGIPISKEDPGFKGIYFYIDGIYSTTIDTAVNGMFSTLLAVQEYMAPGVHNFTFYFPTTEWYVYSVLYAEVEVVRNTRFDIPEVQLVRGEARSVEGRLVDEMGEAVQGVTVRLDVEGALAAMGTTDTEGKFVLNLRLGGEYGLGHVDCMLSSGEVVGYATAVAYPEWYLFGRMNVTAFGGNFTRRIPSDFTGTITDDLGKNVSGANVTVSVDGISVAQGNCSDGRYSVEGAFGNLAPLGPTSVTVSVEDFGFLLGGSAESTVYLWEETFIETIALPSGIRGESLTVRGRLLDGAGNPLPGETVTVEFGEMSVSNVTEQGGIFTANGMTPPLPRGNNTLTLSYPGNTDAYLHPAEDVTESVLVISPTRMDVAPPEWSYPGDLVPVVVTVLDEADGPVVGVRVVSGNLNATTDAQGRAVLNILVPGNATSNITLRITFPGNATLLQSQGIAIVEVRQRPVDEGVWWGWYVLGCLVLVGGGVGGYLLHRRRRKGEVIDIFRQAVRELEAGNRNSAMIFDTYRKLEKSMRGRGVTRKPPVTAREFEHAILEKLPVERGLIDTLIGIFEEARYSKHRITEEYAARAKDAFSGIVRGLEGGGQ